MMKEKLKGNKMKKMLLLLSMVLSTGCIFDFDEEKSVKSDNNYENLCNENKKTDNMIGYLMLITYLDKNNIIKERINELLKNIMNNILEKENDEIFKLLNCIQNICKISKEYINKTNPFVLNTFGVKPNW